MRHSRTGFRHRLVLLALAGSLPGVLIASVLIWSLPWLFYSRVALIGILGISALTAAYSIGQLVSIQLRNIGGLVEAIRVGDFSMRLRYRPDDALGELARDVNQLAGCLQTERLKSEEALRLVRHIVEGIEVAIFALDAAQRIKLVNAAACQLVQKSESALIGQPLASLGMAEWFDVATDSVLDRVFPGGAGLWQLRREHYRANGQPHTLLFITDLRQVLRHEELKAWRRLIRVLSHEVNNSLGPIQSVSATLHALLDSLELGHEHQSDFGEGLALIEARARHLGEFVRRYAALARTPDPHKAPFDLNALLRRLPELYPQADLTLDGPDMPLLFFGDAAHIEQLLINLIKNGVEAGGAPLTVRWQVSPLEIQVLDQGSGIANPANLFVPFYTTKAEGSGIGLVLCRQIVEAHGGSLLLQNRTDTHGCAAILRFSAMLATQNSGHSFGTKPN